MGHATSVKTEQCMTLLLLMPGMRVQLPPGIPAIELCPLHAKRSPSLPSQDLIVLLARPAAGCQHWIGFGRGNASATSQHGVLQYSGECCATPSELHTSHMVHCVMQASDYTQVIGIILGMCMMGYVGDTIGRKWGSVTTAVIMFIGGIMLTCLDGVNEKGLAIMYIVAQFVFGFGVGGEYPMAAGSAAERAEAGGKAKAKKRGREVLLTFSMQVSRLLLALDLCLPQTGSGSSLPPTSGRKSLLAAL